MIIFFEPAAMSVLKNDQRFRDSLCPDMQDPIRMMGQSCISQSSVVFNLLTRMIIWESIVNFTCHETFKSYISKYIPGYTEM
jgi:hypothetical protein